MGFLDRAQQELERAQHESSYSVASGQNYHYVVLQVTLKEKFIGLSAAIASRPRSCSRRSRSAGIGLGI